MREIFFSCPSIKTSVQARGVFREGQRLDEVRGRYDTKKDELAGCLCRASIKSLSEGEVS